MAREDRSSEVIGIACTFMVLSWLTVLLRCYVRIFLVKGFGLDDQVMVLCLLLYTAYLSCQLGGAANGTGKQRYLLTDDQAYRALRFWYFCEIFYTTSTSILKIAVGLFFLRITTNKIHIWIIRFIMIVAAMVGTGYTFLVIFQCKPISYWWDIRPGATGTCLPASMVTNLTYAVSALNSFADWTFGILPIFIVKDLQMKRRVKVVVATIIALAAIGSTATLIRLPYTGTLNGYKGNLLYVTTDFAIWTTVEVGVGITAGCIATLRPLMKTAFFQKLALGSTKPWTKGNNTGERSRSKSAAGFAGMDVNGQPLDIIRPKQITTTTITGGRLDDEETFFESDDSTKGKYMPAYGPGGHGIAVSKKVTTVSEERERAASRNAGRDDGPRIMRGAALESRDSSRNNVRRNSSLESIGHQKPTRVHDSF